MKVVTTLEVMRVLFSVFDALNLNGCVVQLVRRSANHVGDLSQGFERLFGSDVRRHRIFPGRNLPHMDIVNVNYVLWIQSFDCVLKFFNVYSGRCSLHQNLNAVFDNWDSREHDNDREQISAQGVKVPKVRVHPNEKGRDDNADGHQHVTHNVEEGSIDVHVSSINKVVCSFNFFMVVRMIMVVIVVAFVLTSNEWLLDRSIVDGVVSVGVHMVRISMVVSGVVMVMVMMVVAVIVVVVVIVVMVMIVHLTTKMVVSVTRVKDLHLDQIEKQTHDCNDKHNSALHVTLLIY
jgi:hypothetical protein